MTIARLVITASGCSLPIPKGARILDLVYVLEDPVIIVQQDDAQPVENRVFIIVTEGQAIPGDLAHFDYVGVLAVNMGITLFAVYEYVPDRPTDLSKMSEGERLEAYAVLQVNQAALLDAIEPPAFNPYGETS